jgi:hypothetical protein
MTAPAKASVDFMFGLSAEASAAQGEEMRQALSSRFPDCTFLFDHAGASFMEDWIFPIAADPRHCGTDPGAIAEKSGPSLSQIIAVFRNELKRVREINPC